MENSEKMHIDASATKDFFITILVRDIDLSEAIVDLVDNSVDGARAMRGDADLKGLYVNLTVSEKIFEISDNCGGMEPDVARKYAFRFGRDSTNPVTKHSVGQFGVGMKRAIFKIGNLINLRSISTKARFTIRLDVSKWKKIPQWDLQFEELKENEKNALNATGTTIRIENLHEGISNELKLATFHSRLKNMIEAAHAESIAKGLEIKVNEHLVSAWHPKLFHSPDIAAAARTEVYFKETKNPVTVRIYAGIYNSNPNDAGWNVICNGRAILTKNQDNVSGWGDGTPRFHTQYSRFRGFVYFDSNDAGLLPWNTTKTNVDAELPIYQAVRLEMINAMKPVLEFLNKLDRESDAEETPLSEAVEVLEKKPAYSIALSNLPASAQFSYKIVPSTSIKKLIRLQYQRPADQVERMKKSMNVTANSHVGEKSFDYYWKMECEE